MKFSLSKIWCFILLFFPFNFIPISKIYSQISFSSYIEYNPSEDKSEVVSIGDVNNDGLNDVVIGTSDEYPYNGYKIFVFLQNNLGNLSSPVGYIYSYSQAYSGTYSITIGDVNHDNLADVVIGYRDSICIFFQNNSGTLNSVQKYYCGNDGWKVEGLCIGDLNNDGLNDIALFLRGTPNCISIFYQNQSNGFTVNAYPAPQYSGYSNSLKIADINNDNLNDVIILIPYYLAGMYFYYQNVSGYLDNYISGPHVPYKGSEWGFDIGDLNNDGINDIVITESFNSPDARIVLFFYNQLTNIFTPPLSIISYDCPQVIRIVDLNCDERNEIITIHGGWNKVSVYEQDNYNTYNSYSMFSIPYATSYNNQGMCIGDINNDGKKDIVIADYLNDLVTLSNQSVNYENCCILPIKPLKPLGDESICENEPTSIYKLQIPIIDSIIWYLYPLQSGSIILSNSDSCLIAWNNNWSGIAGIYVKSINSCGTRTSDTLFVTLTQLPLLNLGNDTILCSNSTINLIASGNFNSFHWQDNSTNPVYIVTHGGTYFVEASNVCGSRSDTIVITEIPLPVINLISDTVLCTGTSIQFNVTVLGSNTYLWQDNSTSPSYTVINSGIYTVTVTNSDNCKTSKSVVVTPLSLPNIHLPKDSIFCGTLNLTLNVSETGCTYLWQDNSTSPVYQVLQAGLYQVTVTNICGVTTDSSKVILVPFPTIHLPSDTSFCTGNTIALNVTQQAGYSYNYEWQDNSTSPIYTISQPGNYSVRVSYSTLCHSDHAITVKELFIPITTLESDITFCLGESYLLDASYQGSVYLWQNGDTLSQFTVKESGQYLVTVTNVCGSSHAEVTALVQDCSVYLDVPSAFSPNDDGNNDVLYAVGRNITDITFIIYDRWGEKVFESNDLLKGWDGTYQGKQLNAAVFIYYISATSISDGHKIKKQGNISLVK